MNITNLTQHEINIFATDGAPVAAIAPSGLEARIETKATLTHVVNGVEFYETVVLGEPYCQDKQGNRHPLPPMENGTIYIVSGIFRANFDRADFW